MTDGPCGDNCLCLKPKEAVAYDPAPRPRYHVSAQKVVYISESFVDQLDAVRRLNELAVEGYDIVSLRDNEQSNGEIW